MPRSVREGPEAESDQGDFGDDVEVPQLDSSGIHFRDQVDGHTY